MNESYLPYTGKALNYCEGVKSSYQVKTSCMSFQNVLYDWFIDWLLVAGCPLCKCKSLGPLNLILGNPYGNLKKTTYNFELKLHEKVTLFIIYFQM